MWFFFLFFFVFKLLLMSICEERDPGVLFFVCKLCVQMVYTIQRL